MAGELDTKMQRFVDKLSPDKKKELLDLLKQEGVYLAADMEDVQAILERIKDERSPTS